MTKLLVKSLIRPTLKRLENTVKRANRDFFGGLQCFFPFSKQHIFGRQSNVVLHAFGNGSNILGGGGVHWKYWATVSTG